MEEVKLYEVELNNEYHVIWIDISEACLHEARDSLVMKVIYVLHVAKDDMLLVGDAWRNLLHAVGHLPQVGLTDRQIQTHIKHGF